MNDRSLLGAKVAGLFFAVALSAFPQQGYTISAKPGAVNYVEGNATLDGQVIDSSNLKSTFMNAGGLLETQDGKVEVLLTPGVFLRVGENSRVRMLKPSLMDTQIAIEAGESMVEVDQYVKESHLTFSMRGGLTEIEKNGLYRFMADGEASVSVIDGKAEVTFGEKHTNLGKGREALLGDALKTREFDKNREDDLFAWSNIRAQYDASMTYQAAKSAYSSSSGGYNNGYGNGNFGYGSMGYGGFYGQGWFWSSGFDSWLWMPGGAYFSPFGFGFYGPGYVYGAPVVVVPVVVAGCKTKPCVPTTLRPSIARGGGITVPVNPKRMPSLGGEVRSPASLAAASAMTTRTVSASGGLRTFAGAPVSRGGFAAGGGTGGGGTHASAGGGGGTHASAGGGGGSHASAAGSGGFGAAGGGGGGGSHSSGGSSHK